MRQDAGSGSPDRRAALHAHAMRLAGIGAWECDLATERLTWTEGVHRLFDIPIDVPLKRATTVALYVDDSRRDMERMRAEAIRTGQGFALDAEIRTARGETRWMRLSVDVARENGRVTRIFGAKQDITADREALERLRRMAERDPLTALPNRTVFDARYRHIVGDPIHYGDMSALILIDLDGFKPINDTFGHLAGDACLCEIAMRLQRAFRSASLVARLGGDEFAVLLPASLGPARIERMLVQAASALGQPFIWNGLRLDISASLGAALIGRPHLRPIAELFGEADGALYAAKAAGHGAAYVFAEDRCNRPIRNATRRRAA